MAGQPLFPHRPRIAPGAIFGQHIFLSAAGLVPLMEGRLLYAYALQVFALGRIHTNGLAP